MPVEKPYIAFQRHNQKMTDGGLMYSEQVWEWQILVPILFHRSKLRRSFSSSPTMH